MSRSSGSIGFALLPVPEPAIPDHAPFAGHPRIAELLERCTFPEPGTDVVCAVSGGADSLALLILARSSGLAVTAVHVDHGLRAGSDEEAAMVRAAADRFGARFRSERVEIEPGPDLEQRARIARRTVLGNEAMTGHTADDQAETMLVNLLRGSGSPGLAAMRPGHVHPILALRRSETEEVCAIVDLEPICDPSNTDPRFVRNRIRHEVLPLLADVANRDPVPLLFRTAELARNITDDLGELASGLDPTDTRSLRDQPDALVRIALREWLRDSSGHPPSSAELTRVLAVVHHESTACELTGGRRVERTDGILRIVVSEAGIGRGLA